MIPTPTSKVLSSMRAHGVQCLLMGGQACVLYGAAEFSRDTDLAILASPDNLAHLRDALDALGARRVAVPPFEQQYLERGHAVHFAFGAPGPARMRIDVMARMRNVDPFPVLWARRTTLEMGDETIDLLALPDLVLAKKTQRDKDWPMIRRLVDVHYLSHRDDPTSERIAWWLQELRTPALLIEATRLDPVAARSAQAVRPLVAAALRSDEPAVAAGLAAEEAAEREADRAYWAPLRAELEVLRRDAR